MSLQVSCSISCAPMEKTGDKCIWYTVAAAAATTIVGLGGLGSVQNLMAGDDKVAIPAALAGTYGFSPIAEDGAVDTTEFLRYYWFILCFNVFACAFALYAVHFNKLAVYRTALVGVFAVATLLTIQASDAFLAVSELPEFEAEGLAHDRVRTTTAGFIMTAALNAILVLGLGWECKGCAKTC